MHLVGSKEEVKAKFFGKLSEHVALYQKEFGVSFVRELVAKKPELVACLATGGYVLRTNGHRLRDLPKVAAFPPDGYRIKSFVYKDGSWEALFIEES